MIAVIQLELLSEEDKKLPEVQFCAQLDKHLVVGSYDQVSIPCYDAALSMVFITIIHTS